MNKQLTSLLFLSVASFALGCGPASITEVTYLTEGDPVATECDTPDCKEGKSGDGGKKPTGKIVTMKGRVIFDGAPPTLPPLFGAGKADKDPAICSPAPVPNEKLIVGADNGVSNVFVYLTETPDNAPDFDLPKDPVIFDQKSCIFKPHCLLVHTGQPVKVLSDDPIAHNTHTYPKRNSGESKLVKGGDRNGVPFSYRRGESLPFEVKCDYHGWMKAYWLVIDHPYAALTDKDGNFEIPNLPTGKYQFQVWHEGATGGYLYRDFEIEVVDDEAKTYDIPYPATKLSL